MNWLHRIGAIADLPGDGEEEHLRHRLLIFGGLGSLIGALGGRRVGAVGLSVVSSLAHMSGQITVAYLLFIPHPALLKLVPVLLSAALLFGTVSGLIAASVLKILSRRAEERR